MSMSRKQFLRTIVGAGIGVAGVATLAACGGDDGGPADAPAGGSCTTPTATIGSNHGHTLTVTKAEVTAAAAKSYDIMGTATHTHSVMVSAANFATLATGGTVTITSSSSGHTHDVVVMCA